MTASRDLLSWQGMYGQGRVGDQISRRAGRRAAVEAYHCPHCCLNAFAANCPPNCASRYTVFFGNLSDGGVSILFGFRGFSYLHIKHSALKIICRTRHAIWGPLNPLVKHVNDKAVNLIAFSPQPRWSARHHQSPCFARFRHTLARSSRSRIRAS